MNDILAAHIVNELRLANKLKAIELKMSGIIMGTELTDDDVKLVNYVADIQTWTERMV